MNMTMTGMVQKMPPGVNRAFLKFLTDRTSFGGVAAILGRILGNDTDRNA